MIDLKKKKPHKIFLAVNPDRKRMERRFKFIGVSYELSLKKSLRHFRFKLLRKKYNPFKSFGIRKSLLGIPLKGKPKFNRNQQSATFYFPSAQKLITFTK